MSLPTSPPVAQMSPPTTSRVPVADLAKARVRRPTSGQIALVLILGVVATVAIQAVRILGRPPELLVVSARLEDVSRMLAVTGRVEAERTVLVSPQSPGRITEIVRHEGDVVKEGEVLARLADPSAKSDVRQQQAELSSKESDLAQARRDLARASALFESGASTLAELEAARLPVARGTEDVRRLGAVLLERRAQLVLLAPFDGTIVRREGELGQIVGPQSSVFEIATLVAPRVSAEVDERYVRALRRGMRAEILSVGADDAKLAATVSYVAQAVDPQTGAATVRFAYEHAPKEVLVGMSVDVNVSVQIIPAALTVPRETVSAGAHAFVLVISDGRVTRREVTIDDWPAPLVVVRSGLQQGELVAVDPKGAAVGARVRARVMSDGL